MADRTAPALVPPQLVRPWLLILSALGSWWSVGRIRKLRADIKRCRYYAADGNLLGSDIWQPNGNPPSAINRSLWICDAEVTQVKMGSSVK